MAIGRTFAGQFSHRSIFLILKSSFSPFLALRYLKPKRSFVSVITLISVLGVALGVMILLVVIAVFTGYGERIKTTILGFEPHVIVDSTRILSEWPELVDKIREVPGVTAVTPYVRGQVVLDFDSRRLAPMIRAIEPPEGEDLERMQEKIRDGKFELDLDTAVVGDELADGMGIGLGDKITLYSPHDIDEIMQAIDKAQKSESPEERNQWLDQVKEFTIPQELTVTGIFDSGHWDFDSNIIFVHLETGQVLYNLGGDVHGIAVETENGFKADKYRDAIHEAIGHEYRALTWVDMHRTIFEAVAAERQAMYFILLFLMIVSGFCIMNTMITVTYQKRSEIGLLKAIGATEGHIARLFLMQGVIVGLLGVLVGLIWAAVVIKYRNPITDFIGKNFGIDMFAEDIYKIAGGLPAVVTLHDVLWISAGGFVACALASAVPAIMAARLEPAKALRSE